MAATTREKYDSMRSSMRTERSSFMDHWRECSEFVSPRRGRFYLTDRNRGDKRYKSIINSAAGMAHKRFKAGIMAGAVSSAKPWFRTRTPNDQLMTRQSVKTWFAQVDAKINRVLNEGNFYNMMPQFIGNLGQFGTAFMTHVDDFDDVARFYSHANGSYSIAQDGNQRVNTVTREFQQTAQYLVSRFGKTVSPQVQNAYDKSNYAAWFNVVHVIEPNDNYNPGSPFAKFKKFSSCYYEPDNASDKNATLEELGFDVFPGYVGRWDVEDGDIYATDWPAATALGDIKQLQLEEKRKSQAIDYNVRPQLHGPAEAKNANMTGLPGDVVTYDMQQGKKLAPVWQPTVSLQELRLDMDAVEKRIEAAFYNDVLLGITDMEGVQPQNEFYLNLRNQERLMQLGDPLNRYNTDALGPTVKRVFLQLVRANRVKPGILPPPPPELAGAPIAIEFVSTLAMAQLVVTAQPIQQMTQFVIGIMGSVPAAADKFDFDEAIDLLNDAVGAPPELIVSNEQVAAVRQQRAKQQQAQQALAGAGAAADAAKSASMAKLNQNSALGAIVGGSGQ